MRREILRLLAKEALTSRKLSEMVGLSAPTVGHHLAALKKAGLVEIVGTEVETHGIVQKFYRATSQAHVVETRRLSPALKRYFMPSRIERTRGMLAALSLIRGGESKLSSEEVETATEDLARYILEAAERRRGAETGKDPEQVLNEIYKEGLSNLIKARPNIFPGLAKPLVQ